MTPLLKKGPKIHLHEDRSDIILKLPPPNRLGLFLHLFRDSILSSLI